MGYSIRCWDYRFTSWLGFDPNTFQVGGVISPQQPVALPCLPLAYLLSPVQVNLTDVHARELYMVSSDPGEDHNVYVSREDELMLSKMAAGLPAVSPSGLWALSGL